MLSVHESASVEPPARSRNMTANGTSSRTSLRACGPGAGEDSSRQQEVSQDPAVQVSIEMPASEGQVGATFARTLLALVADRVVLTVDGLVADAAEPRKTPVVEQGPQRPKSEVLQLVGVHGKREGFRHHPFGQARLGEPNLPIIQ